MKLDRKSLNEIVFSDSDKDALKGAFSKIDDVHHQSTEDGYYALTDNLPNLVNDLQKAYNMLKAKHKDQHHSEVIAVSRELEIFKNIEALIDGSVLGAVL